MISVTAGTQDGRVFHFPFLIFREGQTVSSLVWGKVILSRDLCVETVPALMVLLSLFGRRLA